MVDGEAPRTSGTGRDLQSSSRVGMAPTLLFAYGTLAPDGPRRAALGGWVADAVRGRLFDLGPYPALIDPDAPGAGWIEGFVRPVDPDELSGRLDPYEGVYEGLY